ncbi:MAG: UDP-N-acetylmuramoyl-tripeptide--D-alanyl-D-alanine ligase [Brevinema sp.]
MFWDQKTLFDQTFFEESLQMKSPRPFVVRYFLSDTRTITEPDLSCFLGIKGENFDGSDYAPQAYEKGVRVFIVGKEVNLPKDAIIFLVPNVVEALGKLASAHKARLMIPHVLITGSVGKTTTRAMCTAILAQKYAIHTAKKNFNNEIGLPLTILETPENAKAAVLEAGMNSKGEIGRLSHIVCPEIAIITNIHLIHAGPLGGLEGVAQAKSEIVEGMDASSILLINKEDPFCDFFTQKAHGKTHYFCPSDITIKADNLSEGFIFTHKNYADEEFFCPLPGTHLALNLAAAFALAEIFNTPSSLIHQGLKSLVALPERMNIYTNDKTTIIADYYNASLPAFKAALDVLKKSPKPRTAIIGDILELEKFAPQVHQEIINYINTAKCADQVLVHGPYMTEAVAQIPLDIPYEVVEDLSILKQKLEKLYPKGGSILLKASHGMKFATLVDKE